MLCKIYVLAHIPGTWEDLFNRLQRDNGGDVSLDDITQTVFRRALLSAT